MNVPYRQMSPWWHQSGAAYQPQAPATFRTPSPVGVFNPAQPPHQVGAIHSNDPRLTPAGDVTRNVRLPGYVPFAVLNPGRLTTTPQ